MSSDSDAEELENDLTDEEILDEDALSPDKTIADPDEEYPAFTYEKKVSGVTVTITAAEGVLPKGTYAEVSAVKAAKAKQLAKEADSEGLLQDIIAFDIKLYDEDDTELDDSWAGSGSVTVSFSGEKLEEKQEQADRVEIQHYDAEDSNPEIKEISEGEEFAIEAEHFSVFAIGFYSVRTASESNAIYVCATGSDADGDGTEENPYTSLAKAFEAASEDEETTIYVMSDLTMDVSARSWNKHIVVKSMDGEQYTVTRGEMVTASDDARRWYNPAMFEANGASEDSASLRFENIILDDNGTHVGQYFVQADSEGDGNTTINKEDVSNLSIVQDAIIATYNGVATITLGDGAVLRNFGGMSAVRVSGGKLVMENGSMIEDTIVTDRIQGESGSFGPAGAVWLQGGELEMEEGSEIKGIKGRAVYIDGGSADVNGTISNITGDTHMWQGEQGIAVHVRGGGNLVLDENGKIDTITIDSPNQTTSNFTAIQKNGGTFETKQGSIISNVTRAGVLYSGGGTDLLNGTIEKCNNTFIISGLSMNTTIGETGIVQNCVATRGDAQAIVWTSNQSKVFLRGTVKNNQSTHAFYIINHGGGGSSFTMYDGAVLTGKENEDGTYKYSGTGVYVNASESSFTMEGGTISGFSTGVDCRGKSGRMATFTMNGGLIENNKSYAVNFRGINNSGSIVKLNGGEIRNNGSSYQISASGGLATDTREHIKVAEGVLKDNKTIYVSLGQVQLDDDYSTISLGSPGTVAIETITNLLHAIDGHEEWSTAGTTGLWFKPTTENFHFKVNRGYSVDPGLGTFFAYIPLTENGIPVDEAELKWVDVTNEETLDVSMTGLVPNTSYAGIFIQNVTRRLKAADIEIYAGGGSGSAEYTTGLPEYTLEGLPSSLYNVKLEVNGQEITLPSSTDEKKEYIQSLFSVSYYDAEGNQITDDTKPGVYTSRLSFHAPKSRSAAVPVENVRINDDEIEVAEGTLIIRNTNAKASVQTADGAFMGEVKISRDGALPEISDNAVAKITYSTGTFFVNGDSKRRDQADGVRLMNDALYDGEETIAMERAFETLGKPETIGADYVYDMRYLDLVDAYNGNVWVTNGTYGGMDIYLPYPDDISEADKTSTDFRLLYLDVDREYGINGNPTMEDMLRNAEVKELDYDTKDNGIKTTIARNEVVGGIYILAHATKVNYLNFEDLAFYLEEGQSTEDRIANFPLLRWSITNSEGTKEIDLVNSDEAKFTIGENDDPWVAENVADPFPFNLTFWNDDGEELTLATSYENMIGTFHARLKPKDGVTNLKLNGALLKSGSLGALTIAPLVDDNPRESFVPVDTAAPTEPVTDKPVTVIPAGTKILVNGEYELKDEAKAQISLLVDHIQKEENEFGKAIKQRLMDDGKVTSIDPSKTGFTIRYLDLVDENDGNVWVKLADNAEMTVYLPYPDGDKSRTYKMFRFSDMHRAYGFDGTEIQNAIDTSRIDEIELEKTELGLKLSVDNLGPFVLTWEIATEPEGKAPSIITETLASGREGSSYSQKLTVTGDTPLTYTVSEGKLPDGLSLSADGTISGRPSARGTYTFTITVSNAAGTDSRQFTIEISRRSGNGSSDSDSGSGGSGSGSSRSWTAGIDGQWVHMDPENFEIPISQDVPAGATPVTSPKWHTWKFYLTNGGILRNGWNYIKNPYASNGQPKEGWFTFDEDGIMQYGWYLSAAGKWYYLHRESDGMLGTMETGWHYDDQDGKWYYLDPRSGEMLLGWQKIDGKWYYFNPTGVASTWNHSEATGGWTFNGSAARPFGSMYVNEVTPDGYQVGADGARIE